jgi:hypothetical protein
MLNKIGTGTDHIAAPNDNLQRESKNLPSFLTNIMPVIARSTALSSQNSGFRNSPPQR